MEEYLAFRKMITPVLIQAVFWIATALIVIGGLLTLVGGESGAERIGGLLFIIFGPLVARIYTELLIIIFRIYDTLSDIRDRLSRDADTT